MDSDKTHERGFALRPEPFGEDAVARRMRAMGTFGEPLRRRVGACGDGDLRQQPPSDRRSHGLAVIGIGTAPNRPTELGMHASDAPRGGTTPEAIGEVRPRVAPCANPPAGIGRHEAAPEAIEPPAARAGTAAGGKAR